MAMFYMQYKGREKAAKVVEFVAKWLILCLSTVLFPGLNFCFFLVLLNLTLIKKITVKPYWYLSYSDCKVLFRPFEIECTVKLSDSVGAEQGSPKKCC